VTTVIIDRPAARNAIDRATAQALAEAFRDFDADPAQHVAVLCGANGHFCAGADLKASSPIPANGRSRRKATHRWGRRACCSPSR
jgi:enoyl-CoA hydratase/carnithine racemase